jgi:hypothetical protein
VAGVEPQPPVGCAPVQRPGNGPAVAALVLGIISLVIFCAWYLSVPCAVLAIIFGSVGRKRAARGATGRGMATAGIVCGIIGIALALLLIAGMLAFFGLGGSDLLKQMQQQVQQQAQQHH